MLQDLTAERLTLTARIAVIVTDKDNLLRLFFELRQLFFKDDKSSPQNVHCAASVRLVASITRCSSIPRHSSIKISCVSFWASKHR